MWGLSIPFWEAVFKAATIAALILGGFGITAAFISAWVGYELTDVVQKDADKRISEANANAAEAGAEAAKAHAEIANANAQIEEARAAIAEANARAAEANRKAEEERASRLKLELRLAPRSIAGQPMAELVNLFKQLGTQRVDVIAYAEGASPDTAPFATALLVAFEQAGWDAGPGLLRTMGGAGVITGVVVYTAEASPPEVEKAANAIVIGLRAWEIAANRWDQHFKPEDPPAPGIAGLTGIFTEGRQRPPIRVLVGTKPQ
jgi:hypothetical protein